MFNPAEFGRNIGLKVKDVIKSPRAKVVATGGLSLSIAAGCTPQQAQQFQEMFSCKPGTIAAVDGGTAAIDNRIGPFRISPDFTDGQEIIFCITKPPTGEQISVKPTPRPTPRETQRSAAHTLAEMQAFVDSKKEKDHPAVNFGTAAGAVERYFNRPDVKKRIKVNAEGMLNKCQNGDPQVPAEYMDQYRSGKCADITLALSKQVLQDPTEAGYNTFKAWVNYTLSERDFGSGQPMLKLTLGMLD